jgi:hypothetical protein
MELERIKKQAQLKLKNNLCNKICAREDECHSYKGKCKIASRDTRCLPYDDCKKQCWYIDCNRNCDCTYNDEPQAAKRPCVKRPNYCNRKDIWHNNQPKKLGHERPKSIDKAPSPINSFPDKLAKHSWADYSENLANQRKQAPQSAVSAHHGAVNNRYLSDDNNRSPMEADHMEAVNDQSLDRHSLSNYNNNTFVTFKAPPPPACKKASEKVKRDNKSVKNKKKTVTSSNDNGKTMMYTQPFAASAKGLDKPLAFSLEED